MVNRLLKTHLRQVSFIGGAAFLAVLLGIGLFTQLDTTAANDRGPFLHGTYLTTLDFGQFEQTINCTFSADLVNTGVEGAMSCTQLQLPLTGPEGNTLGTTASVAQGAWEYQGSGEYILRVERHSYGQDVPRNIATNIAAGRFSMEDGQLTGTFTSLVKDPQGNVLGQADVPATLKPFEATLPETE